jgi:hypothetical protein
MLLLIREMWGFSPVNKRSQRLANDGSRTKDPRLPTTQIDKNRVKRSAPEAGFQAVNGGSAHHWGQFPTFEGKTDSHGRSFTSELSGRNIGIKSSPCSPHFKKPPPVSLDRG